MTDTKPTQVIVMKEKPVPKCHRSHPDKVRTTSLLFCDLRHRLINGAGSRHRVDPFRTKEEKRKVQSVERLGKRLHQSTPRGNSTGPSWTRSIIIQGQQRLPSERSGVWARLSSKNESKQKSGSKPKNSRSNSSGQTRTWTSEPSPKLN
jgi:hypothetical protein